jgi:hypothetical protein
LPKNSEHRLKITALTTTKGSLMRIIDLIVRGMKDVQA